MPPAQFPRLSSGGAHRTDARQRPPNAELLTTALGAWPPVAQSPQQIEGRHDADHAVAIGHDEPMHASSDHGVRHLCKRGVLRHGKNHGSHDVAYDLPRILLDRKRAELVLDELPPTKIEVRRPVSSAVAGSLRAV